MIEQRTSMCVIHYLSDTLNPHSGIMLAYAKIGINANYKIQFFGAKITSAFPDLNEANPPTSSHTD